MADSYADIRRASFLSSLGLTAQQGATFTEADLERMVRLNMAGLTPTQGATLTKADLRRVNGKKQGENEYS